MARYTITFLFFIVAAVQRIQSHGRMTDPPARNTIWRHGFDNPSNVDDNALNCGGFSNQWDKQNGKCGVCGDPYQGPLKHQPGFPGGYANGVIGRLYKMGDFITVSATITANHKGHIEYKICPVNDKSTKASQACLDKYPLRDSKGNGKFDVYEQIGNSAGVVKATVQLPAGLTCSQCVIQWTYTAGNNNGKQQETFRNCADVQITVEGGPHPIPKTPEVAPLQRREGGVAKLDKNGQSEGQWDCDVVAPFNKGVKHQQIYDWCLQQCIEVIPRDRKCPKTHCECHKVSGGAPNRSPQKPSDNTYEEENVPTTDTHLPTTETNSPRTTSREHNYDKMPYNPRTSTTRTYNNPWNSYGYDRRAPRPSRQRYGGRRWRGKRSQRNSCWPKAAGEGDNLFRWCENACSNPRTQEICLERCDCN